MTNRTDSINFALFLLSASLYVLFHFSVYTRYFDEANIVPPPLIFLLSAGIGAGITVGIISTAMMMKSIEQKGEYIYTHKTLMWTVFASAIYLAIAIFPFIVNWAYGYITLDFLLASLATMSATQLVFIVLWEMKNGKLIMRNTKPSKLYAVPREKKD